MVIPIFRGISSPGRPRASHSSRFARRWGHRSPAASMVALVTLLPGWARLAAIPVSIGSAKTPTNLSGRSNLPTCAVCPTSSGGQRVWRKSSANLKRALPDPVITIDRNWRSRCTGNRNHDALEFAITFPGNHDHHGPERAPLVGPSSERSMKEITCTLSIK